MSLQEEIEKDRKALAALTDESVEDGGEDKELVEDTGEVDEPEEPVVEEAKAEDKVPEKVEKVEEPKLDDAGYRRLRREKEAAERRAKELEEKLNAPKEEIPQEEAVNQEVVELIRDKRIRDAEAEFVRLESDFSRDKPEYEEISLGYKTAIYQANRIQNPRASHAELLEMTKNTILQKASFYVNKGLNPIEELFDEAQSLGIKPSKKEEIQEEVEEVKKPSLATVAANKARNAGTAAAKGRGSSGALTPALAADLTSAEWMALPKAERARILAGG